MNSVICTIHFKPSKKFECIENIKINGTNGSFSENTMVMIVFHQ